MLPLLRKCDWEVFFMVFVESQYNLHAYNSVYSNLTQAFPFNLFAAVYTFLSRTHFTFRDVSNRFYQLRHRQIINAHFWLKDIQPFCPSLALCVFQLNSCLNRQIMEQLNDSIVFCHKHFHQISMDFKTFYPPHAHVLCYLHAVTAIVVDPFSIHRFSFSIHLLSFYAFVLVYERI